MADLLTSTDLRDIVERVYSALDGHVIQTHFPANARVIRIEEVIVTEVPIDELMGRDPEMVKRLYLEKRGCQRSQ